MLDLQVLITEHLYLIPYKREFDDYIMRIHNEASFMAYDDNDPVKQREQYLNYIHQLIETGSSAMWLIKHRKFKINLGIIYLTDIIFGITANLHPLIDRAGYRLYLQLNGKERLRFMKEAVMPVIKVGFESFKVQRIGGAFLHFNKQAIRFVKGLGLKQEGLIRHGSRVNDAPQDLVILGMVRKEWESQRNY